MAPIITTWVYVFLIITVVVSVSMKPQTLVEAQPQPQVPCTFFFGDSQFDNGNNNRLFTSAKVNYAPYGIDYPSGATGRFANGPNIPDFLALLLGYQNPIPPFVDTFGRDILKGLNYASGAAGILDLTGFLAGDRFTMNRQLQNHDLTIRLIAALLGRSQLSVKNDYLSKCLYVVNMGSNDYLNNYLVPIYGSSVLYSPARFAEFLIQQFSEQLRRLYSQGARKVAVFGIGLIGCVPQVLGSNPRNASGCVDPINNMVQEFNVRLKPLINTLNNNLANAKFTYINITSISLGDPSLVGIRVTDTPCCPTVQLTGLCVPGSVPCGNRNEYAFWDSYHPTSLLNRATASRAYNATLPTDASPVDIRRLVQQ